MKFLLILFLTAFTFSDLYSKDLPTPSADDTLKVGVVLSGGGAKGIAHIGILEKLEEAGVRIDYITGTSMGALIGSLYSIGYTTDQLKEIAHSSSWEEMFTEGPDRQLISNYQREFYNRTIASFPIRDNILDLPFGLISGQNIYTLLSRLMWPVYSINNFDDFPIPFGTVATDLETGENVTLRSGHLPDAVRASISIPSLMRPHVIDDRAFIDGGLSKNMPVDEVREMGANYVISVNVAAKPQPKDSLRSLLDVFTQVAYYQINRNLQDQIDNSDIHINPEGIDDIETFDFDRVDELLSIGLAAGDRYMDDFRSVSSMQSTPPVERSGITELQARTFNRVIINGNEQIESSFIRDELQLDPGTWLTPDLIEERIEQLYSTELFDLVTYKLQKDEHYEYNYNLLIQVSENTTDVFRVGLRYESGTQASILLGTQFRNLLHNSSTTRFDLRLGNENRFLTDHLLYGALGSRLGVRLSLLYESENVDIFVNNEPTARYKNHLGRAELSVGNFLSTSNLLVAGIRQDFIHHNNIINPNFIGITSQNHYSVFGQFKIDQLNRSSYPTRGHKVVADANVSPSTLWSPIYYSTLALYWTGNYYFGDITLRNQLFAGYSVGDDQPWHSLYSVNRLDSTFGFVRFGGYNRYELTAKNIQMGSLGIQFEPFYHRFINVDVYAGRFLERWDMDFTADDFKFGASLSVGALTILGPIEAIISTSNENRLLGELQIGYSF